MIFSMGKEKKLGQINLFMKASFIKVPNMVMGYINMQMALYIKVIGIKIRYKDLVHIHGQIKKHILVNGKIIICMEKEYFVGLMEEDMTVNIIMIKNTVSVYIHGRMVDTIKENGKMVNNMEKEFIKILTMKKEKDTGKVANELIG
jgi:hypothetical protein